MGLNFLGDSEGCLAGGSFIAICLRTLTAFSVGNGGKGAFFGARLSKLFLDLGFSGGNSGGHSGDGGLSCFFLNLDDGWVAGPMCIFHFPAEAAASATACLAFCSLVGDGESRRECFGDSLNSLLFDSFSSA